MRIFSWNVSDVSLLFPEYSLNFDPHCMLQEPLRSGKILCSKQSDTVHRAELNKMHDNAVCELCP
jgi:hypothetical protein